MKTSNMKVLRHLGRDWLEMVDEESCEKPFFYNQKTKQLSLEPPEDVKLAAPRVAEGQPPRVRRQLAGSWLECEDFRGVFYYNPTTKVTSLEAPSEAIPPPPKLLRTLGGSWLELDKEGEVFYFNSETGLVSVEMPDEAMQDEITPLPTSPKGEKHTDVKASQLDDVSPLPTSPRCEKHSDDKASPLEIVSCSSPSCTKAPAEIPEETMEKAGLPPPTAETQVMLQQEQPEQQGPQGEASVKLKLGDWVICEDANGEFYVHIPTGEEFEETPEELLLLVMKLKMQEQQQVLGSQVLQKASYKSPKSTNFPKSAQSTKQASSKSPTKSKFPCSKQQSRRPSSKAGYPSPPAI